MAPKNGYEDWEITQMLSNALGYPMNYKHASEIMDEVAQLTPTFKGVSYEKLDKLESIQGSRPKEFKDYNDLLELKDLEAVFIGTVPHWHALHFIAACEKGLDIYCEKPLAYDVNEGLAMVAAAQKAGNIVQIGFQRRTRQKRSLRTARQTW